MLDARELERLAFAPQLLEARSHLPLAPLERRELGVGARDLRLRLGYRAAPIVHARIGHGVGAREIGESRVVLGDASGLRSLVLFVGLDLAGDDAALGEEPRALLGHLVLLALRLLLALPERGQPIACALDCSLLGANRVLGSEARVFRDVDELLRGVHLEPARLELGLARSEVGPRLVGCACQALDLGALELEPAGELEIPVRSLVKLQVLELTAICDETFRLRRLPLQRRQAALDLRDDVPHAQQVLLRELHLLFRLLLAALELRDARRFFDQQAPVFRLRTHDKPHLALLDDRVRLRPGAGPEEQIGHVAQAHGRLVDEVFALAGAVEAPRHGNLRVVLVLEGQLLGPVVLERERHFGEVVRRARLAPIEDDVFHRAAAKMPRALLTHAPANRIDDVRLAAAVRTHNRQHVVVEVQNRAIYERLEADKLELLDLHPFTLSAGASILSRHIWSPGAFSPVSPFTRSGQGVY